MSRRPKFSNVQKVSCETDAERSQRQKKALIRTQANARVKAGLTAIFDGCSGVFKEEMVNALIAETANIAMAYRDGPFAASRLGFHAGRVCPTSPNTTAEATAERLFTPSREREAA